MSETKVVVQGITDEDIAKAKDELASQMSYAKNYMKTVRERYWERVETFQVKYNGRNWKVTEAYDLGAGNYEECQLCGFPKCRYKFVIQSSVDIVNQELLGSSGEERLSIGDECVLNYAVALNESEEKALKKVKETMIKNARMAYYESLMYQLQAFAMKSQDRIVVSREAYQSIRLFVYQAQTFINRILKGYPISGKEMAFIEKFIGRALVEQTLLDFTPEIGEKLTKARKLLKYPDYRLRFIPYVYSYNLASTYNVKKVSVLVIQLCEGIIVEGEKAGQSIITPQATLKDGES